MKLLTRSLAKLPELRTEGAATRVVGYGAVFNQRTDIGGMWIEEIAPGAFARAIGEGADVRALFNHDANHILGRQSAGTLTVSEDETGLRYDVTLPASATGVAEAIARRDVTGSSIGFTVRAEEWIRAEAPGQLPVRRITEIDWLRDVGPVTFPAYEQTTADAEARSMAVSLMAPQSVDLTSHEHLLAQLAIDEVE